MDVYFFLKGINKLAAKLKGTENIYVGIRPYGFHAGNMSTLVAYPILLCREMVHQGKKPRFNIYLFINDWEQEKLDGINPHIYPFNVLPRHTTWQFIPDPIDKRLSIVDFWEPIITNNMNFIKYYYPGVSLKTIRNSAMKTHSSMKKYLLKTLRHPEILLKIFHEYGKKPTLDKAFYASAVCPKCKAARGNTNVLRKDYIVHSCSHCHCESAGDYRSFEYWFYHKPLALPRIEAYKIDVNITCCDKYKENDHLIKQQLAIAYGMKTPLPKILYTPEILGMNNKIMGKSKGNAINIGLDKLIQLLEDNPKARTIKIPRLI